MTKAHDKRLEAIERISKVRAEVEAKEAAAKAKAAAKVAALAAWHEANSPEALKALGEQRLAIAKERKRERRQRWKENNPDKAKAEQRKRNQRTKERHKVRMATDPEYRAKVKADRAAKYQADKERLAAKRLARLEEVKAMRDKLTQLSTPYQFVENPMSMIQTMTDETLLKTLQLAVEEREKARKALQVLDAELADFVQHAEKDMPGIEYQAIGADIQGRVNKAVEQLQYAAKKWYHFSSEAKRRGLA